MLSNDLFQRYLHCIQDLVAWFDVCKDGGADEMIDEAHMFLLDEIHHRAYSDASDSYPEPFIDRQRIEGELLALCREYATSTHFFLLELGFMIENRQATIDYLVRLDEERQDADETDSLIATEPDIAFVDLFLNDDDDEPPVSLEQLHRRHYGDGY